jgi:BRCT domain type II-containing protein
VGAGLSIGKNKVKAMIVAFGGHATGSVSGKTSTLLVVGKHTACPNCPKQPTKEAAVSQVNRGNVEN